MIDAKKILSSIGGARTDSASFALRLDSLTQALLSYALGGEDLILRRYFKLPLKAGHKGLFVDIGCAHPVDISNTFHFYGLGWRGLCIDANAQYAEAWATVRPEDTYVCTAVSEAPGQAHLYLHKTIDGRHMLAEAHPGDEFRAEPREVPVTRLDTLFQQHIGDRAIDFISLDVEGHELGVLRSNDWSRWAPKVILMECADFDFTAPCAHPAIAFLRDCGYRLDARFGANVVMVKIQ